MTPCTTHWQAMYTALGDLASATKTDEASIGSILGPLETQDLTDHSDPMVLAFFIIQRNALGSGDMTQTCPACALGVNADAKIAKTARSVKATNE